MARGDSSPGSPFDDPLPGALHEAAASLRHTAALIDLAADSRDPDEGVAYLRIGVEKARAALRALLPPSLPRRRPRTE